MNMLDMIEDLAPRLQRLGLVDRVTGFFDQDEVERYVHMAMRYLATRYQLKHFLRMSRELFRTTASVETYAMPSTYGFVIPQETRRSGLAVNTIDGQGPVNLEYYDSTRYNLTRSDSTTGKPAWFTIAENLIYLQPIPDAVYVIEAIHRPTDYEDVIPDAYVNAVAIQTLWQMASDDTGNERARAAVPQLMAERADILRTLVNNEQREKQRFYTSHERIGFGRRWRR